MSIFDQSGNVICGTNGEVYDTPRCFCDGDVLPCDCPCATYPPASWPCNGLLETYAVTCTWERTLGTTTTSYRIQPGTNVTANGVCAWQKTNATVEQFVSGSWTNFSNSHTVNLLHVSAPLLTRWNCRVTNDFVGSILVGESDKFDNATPVGDYAETDTNQADEGTFEVSIS